jgi:MoaA/NifB/PqqE/SkfB family radical SAM enzyme
MLNLSRLLERLFELHGAVPRAIWKDGKAFAPIHAMFEVTYRCNLRCNFCQYLDIIEGKTQPAGPVKKGDLDAAAMKARIDELPAGRLVSFAGGETLMHKDFPDLIAYASRRHRTHIITNGVLIDERIARLYVDLAPRWVWQNGLVLLEVSLEGDEALHDRIVQRKGSWRRSIRAVERVVRARAGAGKRYPKLDLKLVVTGETVGAMTDFMHLAKRLGVDLVNFLTEHDLHGNAAGGHAHLNRPQRRPTGVDPDEVRRQLIRCFELEKELGVQIRLTPRLPIDEFVRHYSDDRRLDPSEYVCEGIWSRIGVQGDGRYSPLCAYTPTGDVSTDSLAEVWNGAPFRTLRREVMAQGIFPGCSGCCNLKYVGDTPFGMAGVRGAGEVNVPVPAPVPVPAERS